MPRHLLPAFCLSLLLLGCACGPAYAEDDAPAGSVTLFATGTTKVPANVSDEVPTRDVSFFASPFLAAGSGVMVALAEARYTENGEDTVDIVVRYIETEGQDWSDKAIEKNGGNWKTQIGLQRKEGAQHYVLTNPTAVIKSNKIYLLALINQTDGWYFDLSVGAISGDVGSKKIDWGSSRSLHSKLTQVVKNKGLFVFPGFKNSAFLTSNGTIVFSAKATNREGEWGFAIMQLKDDKEHWKVSFVENPDECRAFSLFEWKDRLICVFSGCVTDKNYAKEYDEVEEEWKDADDAFLRFLVGKHPSRDLTPVTIGNETWLLFTGEPMPDHHRTPGIPLWYTEGTRVGHTDSSIVAAYTKIISGGLMYTNGELFFMYQDASRGSGAIVFTHLSKPLREIKAAMNVWTKSDAYLSKPCNETAPKGAFPDTLCLTPMPTNGLVGFLSNWGDSNYWYDEYRFFSALVNGTKVENGYTFNGAGKGAHWPVGQTCLSKRYNFTKYGMTIVATVTVHETPRNNSPLLNVYGVGSNEIWGLWYRDGQWKVTSNNGEGGHAIELKTQKEYRVALMLQSDTISLYLNGNSQGSPLPVFTPGVEPIDINSVYIGGFEYNSGPHMTVTNLFLYNRVLSDTELETVSKTVALETPTASEELIGLPRNTTETTETPTDLNDGSVCVRMSFASLFLLGCLCLAII